MAVEDNKKNDEAEIQRVLEGGVEAIRDKNIEGVMSLYAQEVVSFDIVPRCATWEQMHSGNPGKRYSRRSRVRSAMKFTTCPSRWAMTWPSPTASTG
jgi:hypothetical protein